MRVVGATILGVQLIALCARADTYQAYKIVSNGEESTYSSYRQGKKLRTEIGTDGSIQSVWIFRPEQGATYELDPQAHLYVERRREQPDLILSLAQWIAKPPQVRESGKTVQIYYETIDTGERKEFFGQLSKHFVLRERHVAEPGACDSTHQTEKDGWYISPVASDNRNSYPKAYLATFTTRWSCRDTVVRHGTPVPPGFPVLETDGKVTRELLEYSTAALDNGLFNVPGGYRKVDSLTHSPMPTWQERMGMEWGQLEHAFESWFE